MARNTVRNPSDGVFRIDKFVVPEASLTAFVEQMRQIQAMFERLPGWRQKHLLTQYAGTGEFNVVTMVEWKTAAAMAVAQEIVQQQFTQEGIAPAQVLERLGVRSDRGFYIAA
ncbi:antibiotic biosynthesis monooxygenase [Massilia pseudoviolaceinigra]|uniref:antibiotic biosynthesis monooxygenase n=1 Tax=Massilia pseudoviolaceinigra TaxID=3057165 RepID=UPI002796D013|nr:antibiotic biosynthesis monooxygenase [Massilia sp. CCM 9206]MDQ1924595.1 antibiotic biosynthesis monooxygenase [Massilia sp. CCM 9206]